MLIFSLRRTVVLDASDDTEVWGESALLEPFRRRVGAPVAARKGEAAHGAAGLTFCLMIWWSG